MIAVETNILVYAHRADSPWHAMAAGLVKGLVEGAAPWAIPWPCVCEFLAIVTHPGIYRPPTPLVRALDQVDAWVGSPSLRLLGEPEGHWAALRRTIEAAGAVGPLAHDARIASLCETHGVRELWTADRDFGRFKGIRIRNPLVE